MTTPSTMLDQVGRNTTPQQAAPSWLLILFYAVLAYASVIGLCWALALGSNAWN